MYRLSYYTPTSRINHALALSAAIAASNLPDGALIAIARPLHRLSESTARPRLHRSTWRLCQLVIGDALAIRIARGK